MSFTLLFTLFADAPASAAPDLTSQIASARRSQIYHESVMREQDRQLQRLQGAHKAARKALKQAKRHFKDVKSRRAAARKRVKERTQRLEHIRAKWPEDKEGEETKEPSKVLVERLEQAKDQLAGARKTLRQVERRTARVYRATRARQRRLAGIRRQIRVVVSRQNAAEASLGGQIVSMTRLAQQRASLQTGLRLGPGGDTFSWPAYGSITQAYGCTGFYLNPRRGSCRHFHDGIDMSPDGGTAIRSVAQGVVAYVGWNPWDSEGRAFIVVIGHPDGYHSRYGHLQPTRQVRAGQVVSPGEIIGRMGSTGKSTGVHLHMELLDRSGTVDPLRYLPPREQDQRRQAPAAARGQDAARSGSDRKVKAKGKQKSTVRKARAGKRAGKDAKRAAPGKRKAGAKGARKRQDAAASQGLQEGATAAWVLTWPEPCETATEAVQGSRKRMDVAGLAAGAPEAPPAEIMPGCDAAPLDASFALATTGESEGQVPSEPTLVSDPRAARSGQ